MDYAFCPLEDTKADNRFYANFRQLWTNRPGTRLVHEAGVRRIADFFEHIKRNETERASHLWIGSHGNDTGYMEIEPDLRSLELRDDGVLPGTTFEVLVNAETLGTIRIRENEIVYPRPVGSSPRPTLYIRGCNIGAARPFLLKLRTALGNNIDVNAPKHFSLNFSMEGTGVLEYLGYNFSIKSPQALKRPQIVKAFADRVPTFSFLKGSSVPPEQAVVPSEQWGKWIPSNIGVGERKLSSPKGKPHWVSLGQQIGKRRRLPLGVFRHNSPSKLAHFRYELALDGRPANDAASMQRLRESLEVDPEFRLSEFPKYLRYGYESISDFLMGYRWKFTWQEDSRILLCMGHRHVYVVIPAITDPDSGSLLFNYYPDDKDPQKIAETLSNLEVTHPEWHRELFETV